MSNFIEKAEALSLPLIPLRGTVAFPSVQMNLSITRGISLKAFGQAASHDAGAILVAQKDPSVDEPEEKDFYKVGTVCVIKQVTKTPDGTLTVMFEGVRRARIQSVAFTDGFFRADVVCKKMTLGTAAGLRADALLDELSRTLEEIQPIHPTLTDEVRMAAVAIRDPGLSADFTASAVLLNTRNKQAVLEVFNPLMRLEHLLVLLQEEKELLSCEAKIHSAVREKVDEHQKEFFLREELRAIQQELGEDSDEIEEYSAKIDKTPMPDEAREKLRKELGKLAKTPYGAAESVVLRNYLDTCLELPWNKKTKDKLDMAAVERVLNADHDGLDKVKERILEYVAVRKLAPDIKNQILCLVGPPGVGKTSVAASVARALGRKYSRISLGGIRDEADIRGHRKTYVGAMPGRIVTSLTNAKSMNPVIVLDEVDKLSRDLHGDPSSALLEVLDPEQNKYFRDHFLEMPLDLSDCLFIATANYYDNIPEALIDRMEIIEVKPYTRTEKFAIALHHLIPKQMKRHGLTKRTLLLRDDAVYEIIDHYTREAGVRNLERELAALFRRAAKKIAGGEATRVRVDAENLRDYLGKRKFRPEQELCRDEVGVINGLAYTSAGGDILRVEALPMPGTGKIELTGSLGEVMKESAHIAYSCVRARAASFGLDPSSFAKEDIHIHFPEGAVPKDGPSAGVTMVSALVSALTGIPARCDVAMTGEVTLHGRVLPIGGLTEKTMAAYRAGIKTVLIPRDNERDLDEIDKEAAAHLRFILCDTVDDVLKNVLRSQPTPYTAPVTAKNENQQEGKLKYPDIPVTYTTGNTGISVTGNL